VSRAIFLALDEEGARARCLKENVGVSAVENIPGGGVRLVCMSADGAAIIRRKLKTLVIAGDVVRERHRPTSPLW